MKEPKRTKKQTQRLIETPCKEYFVAFFTKDCPDGTIDAVRVRVDMVRQEDMNKEMSINLCDHPLYAELRKYVEANK